MCRMRMSSHAARTFKIFHLLAGADEIKHRHALRQRHHKCREQAEQHVLRKAGSRHHHETHDQGGDEANDGD